MLDRSKHWIGVLLAFNFSAASRHCRRNDLITLLPIEVATFWFKGEYGLLVSGDSSLLR